MGEKIKDLSRMNINGVEVNIELNDGYSPDYSKYDIHIQSEHIQYCLSEREFMKLASLLITARRKMESLKGVNNEHIVL